jgi:hypothetical protein
MAVQIVYLLFTEEVCPHRGESETLRLLAEEVVPAVRT